MTDLIDRAAALAAAEGYVDVRKRLRALPAQGAPEIEERKFYHDAWPLAQLLEARDLGNGLLTDDGEAWRYRLTHSDARGKYDVLFRPTRKIAALEPAEAGGVEHRIIAGAREALAHAKGEAESVTVHHFHPTPVDALVKAALMEGVRIATSVPIEQVPAAIDAALAAIREGRKDG